MWVGPTHRTMSTGFQRETEAPQESCFHLRVTGLYGEHFLGSRNPRRARALGVSGCDGAKSCPGRGLYIPSQTFLDIPVCFCLSGIRRLKVRLLITAVW